MAAAAADSASGMTASGRLTLTGWLVCGIAAIGFAFDIYELLMLPLVIKPAIRELSEPLVAHNYGTRQKINERVDYLLKVVGLPAD